MMTEKPKGNAVRSYVVSVVIAMLSLFAAAGSIVAQEVPDTGPKTWELRCRGGRMGFRDRLIRRPPLKGKREVKVTFSAGTQPAGDRLPTNLAPGQCSWIDRGFRSGEPTQINLVMTTEDAERIARILALSDRFWTFSVYNTNRGYFQSRRDSEWEPYR